MLWGHTQEATFGDDHDTINHKIAFYKEYKNDKFGFFKDALYTFFRDAEEALKTPDVRGLCAFSLSLSPLRFSICRIPYGCIRACGAAAGLYW